MPAAPTEEEETAELRPVQLAEASAEAAERCLLSTAAATSACATDAHGIKEYLLKSTCTKRRIHRLWAPLPRLTKSTVGTCLLLGDRDLLTLVPQSSLVSCRVAEKHAQVGEPLGSFHLGRVHCLGTKLFKSQLKPHEHLHTSNVFATRGEWNQHHWQAALRRQPHRHFPWWWCAYASSCLPGSRLRWCYSGITSESARVSGEKRDTLLGTRDAVRTHGIHWDMDLPSHGT